MALSPVGGMLSVTFDNLGEAAELELGALASDAPLGRHPTATEVVPGLLERLAAHGIAATFFVEGLNTELYPDLLGEIAARGHEVAYHAWRHERWDQLSAAEQAENLSRGIAAFGEIGIEIAGFRPPGGGLGEGGTAVLREAGLRHCSPAGSGAGVDGGVALLPFEWRHVDATCVLPSLAEVRERMAGTGEAIEPEAFVAWLEGEISRLTSAGGYLAIVLHPFMLAWLDEERLERLLEGVAAAANDGKIKVSRCDEVAARVLADPASLGGETVLDATSWA